MSTPILNTPQVGILGHAQDRGAADRAERAGGDPVSTPLVNVLVEALTRFSDEDVRAAVLRARPGVKVWSAGHDVNELPEAAAIPLDGMTLCAILVRAIEEASTPIIAMIEGGVWGGACELAFACDRTVAAPNVAFAVTPARLGVPYNASGMLTFLNACSLRIVKEMVFTAKPLTAERAERLGIVNHMALKKSFEASHLRAGRGHHPECATRSLS